MKPDQRKFVKEMIEEHAEAIRDHTEQLERYKRLWQATTGTEYPIRELTK